jgi:hypothetical protein
VYKLKMWGALKYNVSGGYIENEKGLLNGQGVEHDDIDSDSSSARAKRVHHKPMRPQVIDSPYLSHTLSNSVVERIGSDLPEEVDDEHMTDVQWDMTPDAYKKKLAADFFFALAGDKLSFPLYFDLYQSRLASEPPPSSAYMHWMLVACARAAESERDGNLVRRLLKERLTHQPIERSFLYRILIAYTIDREATDKSTETASEHISKIIPEILTKNGNLRPLKRETSVVDIITYQYLCYGFTNYCKKRPHESFVFDTVCEFISQQRIQQYVERGNESQHALRSCVDWCVAELESIVEVPPLMREIECQETNKQWKARNELFCCLWDCWRQHEEEGGNDDCETLAWARDSQSELGYSPAELLVTVCWLIMDQPAAHDNGNTHDHPNHQASKRAEVVSRWTEEELWTQFLTKVESMNKLVKMSDEDKEFKARYLDRAKQYLEQRLKFDIASCDDTGTHSQEGITLFDCNQRYSHGNDRYIEFS